MEVECPVGNVVGSVEQVGSLCLFVCQWYTSYLSRAPWAVPVEKNLSCGEICPHDRWWGGVILHMTCGQILHMGNVKIICNVEKYCVQCMVFCHILRYFVAESVFCDWQCFVAIHALLRGETVSNKIVPVEKKWQILGMTQRFEQPFVCLISPTVTHTQHQWRGFGKDSNAASSANGAGEGFSLECRAHWHTDNGQLRC